MWVLFFQCAQGLLVHRVGIAAALSDLKKLPDIGLKRGIDLMKLDITPSVLHHGDEHVVARITSGGRAAEIPTFLDGQAASYLGNVGLVLFFLERSVRRRKNRVSRKVLGCEFLSFWSLYCYQ